MSYETAVEQMFELGHELAHTPSHKFDLAYMRVLLAALGNPEQKVPSVLVAGTNGKGSTSATLASILRASGFKTGLYTSPHLVRINERIRIDEAEINDQDFERLHATVEQAAQHLVEDGTLPWHPSFFEMLTAMAFVHFASKQADIVVLEVGMGGRLDATNVVEPRLSIITDIALDHQKYLGETVPEIAREKAGIIRPGEAVITLPQLPEANDVIGNTILELGARAINAVAYVPPVSPASADTLNHGARNRYPLEVLGARITVDSPLPGRHQLRNVALAIAAAEELRNQGMNTITAQTIETGIRETHWPGRFQVIPARNEDPEYVFDVAHNPAGAWALRSTLSASYETQIDRGLVTIVFGVMRDKAVREIVEILFPLAAHIVVTHADNPRAATTDEIREAASRSTDLAIVDSAPDVSSALNRARELAGPSGVVVVTGSIYIVGEAMQRLGVRI